MERNRLFSNEIPFGVNKANLITKMASLVREKDIQGVIYLNDESNREGIRIVMELKKECSRRCHFKSIVPFNTFAV